MAESEIFERDHEEFARNLWSLKNDKKFCDSTITANGEKVDVHTLVVACFSKLFENQFFNTDSISKDVPLNNVDSTALNLLVEFIYTGNISKIPSITEENAKAVFDVANLLQVSDVSNFSSEILKSSLSPSNSLSIWKSANKFNSENLKKATLAKIKENFDEIIKSNEFKDLEFKEVKTLLSCSTTISAGQRETAVNNWINKDTSCRSKFRSRF